MIKKYIGDKKFYRKVALIALPITVQQFVTATIQIVDNFMVGKLGEEAINAVTIPNQLFFVMILLMFGLVAGAGIYTAQYFGSKDIDKLKQSFRFKISSALIISVFSFIILSNYGRGLIGFFVNTESTIDLAEKYLRIVRFNVFPLFLIVAISTTFREIAKPKVPMYASITAILVNTFLNYILIFGKFGAPALGVEGAAYATVFARYLEFAIIYILVKKHGKIFDSKIINLLRIDKRVFGKIILAALPLMTNEIFWSLGQTMYVKAYSTRGDFALAAFSISNSVSQIVFVIFSGMSGAIAVMVGNTLGENKLEDAKSNADKLIAFSIMVAAIMGVFLIGLSFVIPNLYEIESITRDIVRFNLRVNGVFIPLYALNVGIFFALRSGGDTRSTLIMDAVFMWVVSVPLAIGLAYFTKVDVRIMFLLVQATDILKFFLARNRYNQEKWVQNLAK